MKTVFDAQELVYFLDQPVQITRNANRKTMTVKVQIDQPLRVVTHTQVATAEIVKFLNSKKKWIEKNLVKINAHHVLNPIPEFVNGSYFPFLGELKYFQFATCGMKKITFKIEDGFIICRAKEVDRCDKQRLSGSLKLFYKSEAVAYLTQRVQLWSERTGLIPQRISFRAPRTRWGSCSSHKRISLNWKLICQSPQLIDYVIIHELCHLRFLNHSDDFWNLLESIMPVYQEIEDVLQQHVHLGNFLK